MGKYQYKLQHILLYFRHLATQNLKKATFLFSFLHRYDKTCDAMNVCSKEAWEAYDPEISHYRVDYLDVLDNFCTADMKQCRDALADRDWKRGCASADDYEACQ